MPEVLYFPTPGGSKEALYPYFFHVVFNALPLNRWQIIQEQDGLHIFLVGAAEEFRHPPGGRGPVPEREEHDSVILRRRRCSGLNRFAWPAHGG